MDQQWLLIVVAAVALAAVAAAWLVRGRKARPQPRREAARPEHSAPAAQRDARPVAAKQQAGTARGADHGTSFADGLRRTRGGFVARLTTLLGRKEIDAAILDEIEEALLTADIGVRTSHKLFEAVRARLDQPGLRSGDAVWAAIREESHKILSLPAPPLDPGRAHPLVLLVIGVNGAGKTTTIGKLAARFIGADRKVLLAAGDTFRAAAVEQLEIWAQRVGAEVQKGKDGGDPSSVIFDAVKRGRLEGYDVVIADTAGRLQTKTNLMEELQKIRRVLQKLDADAPHETLLVLDATNGQNAISQAQLFKEAMGITGIVLTKLDGTAKGGVILGICEELKIPVRFVGVGEKVSDLKEFDATAFVEALYQQDEAA